MPNKMFAIMKKNLKVLLRTRVSALIILVGPIFLFILAGIAFNNNQEYSVNIGVYAKENSYSTLTESFIDLLKNNSYQVTKLSSETSCKDQIKSGSIHACIIFPKNMEITDGVENNIEIYADSSRFNIVWSIIDSISSKLSYKSSELSIQLTDVLLEKLKNSQVEIKTKEPVVLDIRNKNDADYAKLNEIYGNLNQLTFEVTPANLNEITTITANMSSQYTQTVQFTKTSYDEIKKIVANITLNQTEQNAANTKIASYISNSTKSLDNFTLQFATNYNQLPGKLAAVKSTSDDAANKLNAAKSTVDSSKSAINGQLVPNVLSMKTSISDIENSNQKILTDMSNIKVTSSKSIATPITTSVHPIVSGSSKLRDVFSSILILIIMLIGILLGTISVIMEKKSKSYFRNYISPTSSFSFVLATFLTNILIIIIQVSLILVLVEYFFKIGFTANWINSVPLLFLIISLFVLIGMFIGYIFNSEETGILAAISLSGVFLFISDVILPLESIPKHLVQYANFNPFVMSANLFKQSLLFGRTLKELLVPNIYIMLGIIIGLYIIVLTIQKIQRTRVFMRTEKVITSSDMENLNFNGKTLKTLDSYIEYIEALTDAEYSKFYSKNKKKIMFWLKYKVDSRGYENLKKLNKRQEVLNYLKENYNSIKKETEQPDEYAKLIAAIKDEENKDEIDSSDAEKVKKEKKDKKKE